MSAEEKALEREAKRGMNDDEASFAVESNVEQSYEWSDKYRYEKIQPTLYEFFTSLSSVIVIIRRQLKCTERS